MNLEALWQEIKTEQQHSNVSGLTVRRVDPRCPDDLFVGTRAPEGTRAVLLRLASAAAVPKSALVQSRGFTTRVVRFEHDPQGCCDLLLEAAEPSFNAVFAVLAEDLAGRILSRPGAVTAASAFLSALQHWKRFFDSAGAEGLSSEQQLGLVAELSFLERFAFANIADPCVAVAGWVGPDPLSKDFEYAPCAIEVKGTALREPAKVRINGERQLDSEGIARLFLFVLTVERAGAGGVSLPEMVQALRDRLAETAAHSLFEEKLVAYGYHDLHRSRYDAARYIIHGCRTFDVRAGFPRLAAGLPPGVGDLSYTVTLSACTPFSVEGPTLAALLSSVNSL